MKKIILIGGGGHCNSCIDVIEQQGIYEILGIIDKASELGKKVLGYKVVGTDDDLSRFRDECDFALVTVGQIRSPELRSQIYKLLKELAFYIPVVLSPLAYVSKHAVLGQGTIVMHDALVNAGVTIGQNCIINSQVLVEHNATIGNHCHIATGAILNGGVSVGDGSFIGSGATLKQGISLGSRVVVGMGELLKRDLLDNVTYSRK